MLVLALNGKISLTLKMYFKTNCLASAKD